MDFFKHPLNTTARIEAFVNEDFVTVNNVFVFNDRVVVLVFSTKSDFRKQFLSTFDESRFKVFTSATCDVVFRSKEMNFVV